ncbi:hypothetical protein QBC32DRAFT_330285 [Pseudoneurospora amorphoporcata]|uniref:Uncharacterized protein n=1 Tax=Pseudoneurospora amorphoporcata TaxID=241081 RepID=A0AAN6P2Y8_9PEZI|nr:hypothetical protein QBC32DRAFT_330285 [Pseudoneurospora amorphoporcata]
MTSYSIYFSHMFPVIFILVSPYSSSLSPLITTCHKCVCGPMDQSVGGGSEKNLDMYQEEWMEWDRKGYDGEERHAATIKLPGCHSKTDEALSSSSSPLLSSASCHMPTNKFPSERPNLDGPIRVSLLVDFHVAVSAVCDFNSTIYPFAYYWDKVVGWFVGLLDTVGLESVKGGRQYGWKEDITQAVIGG